MSIRVKNLMIIIMVMLSVVVSIIALVSCVPNSAKSADAYFIDGVELEQYRNGDYLDYSFPFGYEYVYPFGPTGFGVSITSYFTTSATDQIFYTYEFDGGKGGVFAFIYSYSASTGLSYSISDNMTDTYYSGEVETALPLKVEVIFIQVWSNLRFFLRVNDRPITFGNSKYIQLDDYFVVDVPWDMQLMRYSAVYPFREILTVDDITYANGVTFDIRKVNSASISQYTVDFVSDNGQFEQGVAVGKNQAEIVQRNWLPSIFGAVYSFFVGIASYEVMGISLLKVLIAVASLLVLVFAVKLILGR